MTLRIACIATILIFVAASSRCIAGSLQGRATGLEGESIGIVNILVEPVAAGTGFAAQTFVTNANGDFSIPLPNGVFVNVTFFQAGRTPATFTGLSGDSVGNPANVALPEIRFRPCYSRHRRGWLFHR
jgi:hypothetical protein